MYLSIKLTLKQKKFADEYIISGNATESYLKSYAKQSRVSAEANARKLLGNYSVKTYIQERLKEIDDKKIADQKEVLERLTKFGRREEFESVVVMVDKATFDDKGKFVGIEKKPEIVKIPTPSKDTIKALELLGKRYRIFSEKSEVEEEQLDKLDKILGAIDDAAK
jgi:phage terminase family protein